MQEHVFNYFPLLAELDMYLQCRRFASPREHQRKITTQRWLQIRAFPLIGNKRDLTPTIVKVEELSAQTRNFT